MEYYVGSLRLGRTDMLTFLEDWSKTWGPDWGRSGVGHDTVVLCFRSESNTVTWRDSGNDRGTGDIYYPPGRSRMTRVENDKEDGWDVKSTWQMTTKGWRRTFKYETYTARDMDPTESEEDQLTEDDEEILSLVRRGGNPEEGVYVAQPVGKSRGDVVRFTWVTFWVVMYHLTNRRRGWTTSRERPVTDTRQMVTSVSRIVYHHPWTLNNFFTYLPPKLFSKG